MGKGKPPVRQRGKTMRSSPAPPAIRFESVSVVFRDPSGGEIPALSDISGTVPSGDILTVMGPSGSGKSTLLSTLNLLCTPGSGRLWIEDREVRSWIIPELRRVVGMVFQTPTMLPGTVRQNLEAGPRLHGRTLAEPASCLTEVGLDPQMLDRPAAELSGGQMQRVALARTLANQPRILLLDEVTSALDPGTTRGIEEMILSINRQRRVTVVWVTHHLQQAQKVGNWTWFLSEGRLVEAGPTEQIFNHPGQALTRQFLQGKLVEAFGGGKEGASP